jgi:hypothetical protein
MDEQDFKALKEKIFIHYPKGKGLQLFLKSEERIFYRKNLNENGVRDKFIEDLK